MEHWEDAPPTKTRQSGLNKKPKIVTQAVAPLEEEEHGSVAHFVCGDSLHRNGGCVVFYDGVWLEHIYSQLLFFSFIKVNKITFLRAEILRNTWQLFYTTSTI